MMEIERIIIGIEIVKKEDFSEKDEGRGRGHSMKLFKNGSVWIFASTSSVTWCVTSGTSRQRQ